MVDETFTFFPFAGRQVALARLHHHCGDSTLPQAFALLGWPGSGKSALLAQCETAFGDHCVCVIAPLEQVSLRSEGGLIRTLAALITAALERRGFSTASLPAEPDDDTALRDWFRDGFLTRALSVIRAHRRLALLVDDAERLIDAIADGNLPFDLFTYLHGLLPQHLTLRLVVTLDLAREADLAAMQPMIGEDYRLTRLTQAEIAEVVAEAHVETVYRATGGFPTLLQHAVQRLRGKGSDSEIRSALTSVYAASSEEFRDLWLTLTQNERLVLTAISSLLYADPLGATTPEAISVWLVETDYPLDITAIKAALRSLEYREILTYAVQASSGFVPSAGLMQTWLLENARLDTPVTMPSGGRRTLLLALVLLVGLALLVGLLLSAFPPAAVSTDTPAPTVTLAGGG